MPTTRLRNLVKARRERDPNALRLVSNSFRGLRRSIAASSVALLCLTVFSQARAQTYTVIHNFSRPDGWKPNAGVLRDNLGNLYGTTLFGGSTLGNVFRLDPAGNETVLHEFERPDGSYPDALTIDVSGNLYGAAYSGGNQDFGTVFKIDSAGNHTTVYKFSGGTDGAWPSGGLIRDALGNLYGTTQGGGTAKEGVIFKIDPAGNETVLYNFVGGTDGVLPGGLVRDDLGNLYGTTVQGGSAGYGTVFRLTLSGDKTTLHDFGGSPDGSNPAGALIRDTAGNVYGVTSYGGIEENGVVFKIDPSGNETVIYRFTGADGQYPGGLILDSAGNLYGVTGQGGSANNGTVFKIDVAGNETVLHSFVGSDGDWPCCTLARDASGTLYGIAQNGGTDGRGTVFKIDFSIRFSSFRAKLDTRSGPPPGFELQAFFAPGSGALDIDPGAQGMTLVVGTYTVSIPPASFRQAKKGWWTYSGMIGGVKLDIRISQPGNNLYEVQMSAAGVDLTSLTNPVMVKIAIGGNYGNIGVKR